MQKRIQCRFVWFSALLAFVFALFGCASPPYVIIASSANFLEAEQVEAQRIREWVCDGHPRIARSATLVERGATSCASASATRATPEAEDAAKAARDNRTASAGGPGETSATSATGQTGDADVNGHAKQEDGRNRQCARGGEAATVVAGNT